MSWNKCTRNQTLDLLFSVSYCNWVYNIWINSWRYQSQLCEISQNRQSSTYTEKITVLDINRHESILLSTKLKSNKVFCNVSYQRCANSYWTYRIFFNLTTTSYLSPSLFKYLVSSMNNVSPLGMYTWAKEFVKSIIWLWKTRIHCKININIAMAHCTTE